MHSRLRMALIGLLGLSSDQHGALSGNFQPVAAADRPADATLAHDPRHLLAERAFEHRPPGHERELAALLDERELRIADGDGAAVDTLDPLPTLRGDERRGSPSPPAAATTGCDG